MNYNLNYHNNNNQKKIEYIAYQFCNDHQQIHIYTIIGIIIHFYYV